MGMENGKWEMVEGAAGCRRWVGTSREVDAGLVRWSVQGGV